ncbi:VENN motif pre-toxin domain-containing protein [Brenneria uluponensis]|uniref:VENN motif pre-toxin domain-containing protein n=1 Tax=Brenneria uluponensis TaxID=3057057 RepID=UPI0028E95B84|nr:VENN motif pre-toxin domain-containing protein [Brenneria ulupoensis]
MGHAVVGAVVAELSGQNVAAGAVGAAGGELAARSIMAYLYPGKETKDLTEEEKQSVSALATVASGLASGLVTGDTTGAASGAQAGRNAVENNFFAPPMPVVVGGEAAAMAGAVGQGVRQGGGNADDEDMGGSCEGTREQCAVRDGTRGPGHVLNGDGSSTDAQPNVSKNLSDQEKAELGGSGSGTPGGWGPQDEENARNQTDNQIGKWSIDELSDGAKHIDPASKKGDLTLAGRALQKHGSREGSSFPSAKGNPSAINEQGQKIVDSILNDPNKSVVRSNTGRYGQVTDVISSSGRGLRYDAQGKLIGFLEPPK